MAIPCGPFNQKGPVVFTPAKLPESGRTGSSRVFAGKTKPSCGEI